MFKITLSSTSTFLAEPILSCLETIYFEEMDRLKTMKYWFRCRNYAPMTRVTHHYTISMWDCVLDVIFPRTLTNQYRK